LEKLRIEDEIHLKSSIVFADRLYLWYIWINCYLADNVTD